MAPVEIFCCYARQDKSHLDRLKKHLVPLQRQGLITIWNDADISPGTDWKKEIKKHLNTAQIILLLVSPDFMASDYCYSVEMKRAMERHEWDEARVIPIILRPIDWEWAPFGKLQALPANAHRIRSDYWRTIDHALYDVVKGIRKVIEELAIEPLAKPTPTSVADDEQHNTFTPVTSGVMSEDTTKPVVHLLKLTPEKDPDLIIFHRKDDEGDYHHWVAEHRQNGFVVVKDGPRWRLHHADCHFITDPIEKGQSLMTYPKICSTKRSKLDEEARKHNITLLTRCYCQQ
jgi:TIR domain